MVYSSLPFLFVFLPCLLAAYFSAPHRLRNPVLVFGSLVFYAWGGMDFFAILISVIVVHWIAGCGVQRLRDMESTPLMWTVVALIVVFDVGLIGVYKYANFLVAQSNALAVWFHGAPLISGWREILLPIGISFFTFQAISYVVDIANGKIRALANPSDFALYIALFPQLIAGPIVRFAEVADQIKVRAITGDDFSSGLLRLAHGISKKVLIADPVSLLADGAFAHTAELSLIEAWVGALAYAVQIYFDFSGYSDMAIGLGRMFGFRFPENFNRPYAALSITEFWRRWHMTLSRWFRDYVYIPLGGSRMGISRTYVSLLAVFVATGLWHGANWTFLAWGLWHGVWLLLERTGIFAIAPTRYLSLGRARTLLAVIFGWVFFRAESLTHAAQYLAVMTGIVRNDSSVSPLLDHLWWHPLAAFATGCCYMFVGGAASFGPKLMEHAPSRQRAAGAVLGMAGFAFSVVNLVSGSVSPFLYFRF